MSTRKQQPQQQAATGTRVYCGPTIRGVVKQFTFYTGKLPPALVEKAQAIPAINALIVPAWRFSTRTAPRRPSTATSSKRSNRRDSQWHICMAYTSPSGPRA